MKVGVLLTGHSRSYEKTFDSLKQLVLDEYDCDIYINTWDVTEPSADRKSDITFSLPNKPVEQSLLIEKYSPYLKKYNFESWENYKNNRFPNISFIDRDNDVFKINERAIYHGSYWVERLRDQWWMVQRGWNLIENPYEYDVIFRFRFDLILKNIQFKKAKFVVPKSEVEFYKIGTHWSDHFAYGEPDSMEKYCNIFNHIEHLYRVYNIDISHAELMNEFYIKEYQKIESFIDLDIKYLKV
jgi:hypothetical protein